MLSFCPFALETAVSVSILAKSSADIPALEELYLDGSNKVDGGRST